MGILITFTSLLLAHGQKRMVNMVVNHTANTLYSMNYLNYFDSGLRDALVDRALEMWSIHHEDVENTTLAKVVLPTSSSLQQGAASGSSLVSRSLNCTYLD